MSTLQEIKRRVAECLKIKKATKKNLLTLVNNPIVKKHLDSTEHSARSLQYWLDLLVPLEAPQWQQAVEKLSETLDGYVLISKEIDASSHVARWVVSQGDYDVLIVASSSNDLTVSMRRVDDFLQRHCLTRFTEYYVDRVLQTIAKEA
jgi:hypothetical protein